MSLRPQEGSHGMKTNAPSNAVDMNRSTIFQVDDRCDSTRQGGDGDDINPKPHQRNRFLNAPPPQPPSQLLRQGSHGASSFRAPPPTPPPPPLSPPRVQAIGQDERVQSILADMRAALRQRGAVGISGLARNFKIVDTDRSGMLSCDELAKCLRLCKIELAQSDLEHLFAHAGEDGRGQIDYDEFLTGQRSEGRFTIFTT